MQLRQYQQECVDIVNSLPDGARTVVAIATGLGKTVVGANLELKGRMLWISHRDELVRQPERYFSERGLSFGVEQGPEHEHGEDVVSASIQSLSRDNRLSAFPPDAFDVIVCDEAHHAAAATYKKVFSHFRPRKLVGLTATPRRGDNVRLDEVFDDICFVRDIRWGIKNGYLAPIRCARVYSNFDISKLKKNCGEYSASDLETHLKESDDDMVVARAYLDYCLPEKRQTLVYCPTLMVCGLVAGTIWHMLPEALRETVRVLSGDTPREERAEILEKYRTGEVNCIVNCMILTEGTDLPETGCIINNRPSANQSLYQQIVGRGTRLAEGKKDCLVIDVIGENSRGHGICTAPTLFGIDPDTVPEKILGEMEKTDDLLALCESLFEARAREAENLAVYREMIDIFTQERIGIIEKNKGHGFAAIADASAALSEGETPIDFGDLVVEKTPAAEHRYEIRATYNGRIWVSDPDMLGKVTMEFDIPGKDICWKDISFISGVMPGQEAVGFIQGFLKYCIPDQYACIWSNSGREYMKSLPATEKQVKRIENDYRQYGVGRGPAITRLQASDLINLKVRIDEYTVAGKDMAGAIEDAGKKRRGKALKKWREGIDAARMKKDAEREAKERAFQEMYTFLCGAIEKQRKAEEERSRKAMESIGKEFVFPVRMNYGYRIDTKPPTEKQISFLNSLVSSCRTNGIEFTGTDLKFDRWRAGCLISLLIPLSNMAVPDGLTYTFDLRKYLEETSKIPKEGMPETVGCPYTVSAGRAL